MTHTTRAAAKRQGDGVKRFFADQAYHFQTLRALDAIPAGGADTAEVLQTIGQIRTGDAQSWHDAWSATGDRVANMATQSTDKTSRGLALFRAHTYYRTAEFFLASGDPKRKSTGKKTISTFYAGLDTLGVSYERIKVPYGDGTHLNAVYYPATAADPQKPLIMFVGGYDSTLEELYFALAQAARDRGFATLTYEGPGQGGVLREQGLTFIPEWEKPNTAVLDAFLASHEQPKAIILVGMSLGGYLAPRAAAFDSRIDGVVAYDALFDFGAIGRNNTPSLAFWLRDHGLGSLVKLLVGRKARRDPGFAWAISNGERAFGTRGALETIDAFAPYTLKGVSDRITADVLIFAGVDDHFVPVEQARQFARELSNARSVTTHVYDRDSGGAEHCQLGATTLWQGHFFDWIEGKFPSGSLREPHSLHQIPPRQISSS
jgi:alpha-beta hydrolase superfamily lysophospholipase